MVTAKRPPPSAVATCACGATFRATTRNAEANIERVNAQLVKHYRECSGRRRRTR